MDTIEFNRLVGALDQQLSDIKKRDEERKKREELQQRLRLVEHWIEGLKKRLEDLTAIGAVPIVDVGSKLEELKAERDALARRLSLKEDLAQEDIDELLKVISATEADLSHLSPPERWIHYEIWACRWRAVADRLVEEVVNRETVVRKCYAVIRESMDREGKHLSFIKALDKHETDDWEARIEVLTEELAKVAAGRAAADEARAAEARREKEREEAQDAAVWNLMEAVRSFKETRNEETERRLRHCLRQAAKFEHLREEAAEMARTHRNVLEPEFSFLWPREAPAEEAPSRKLANREIVARLVRRMKSKCLIGACHGPFDLVVKGFPDHDKGRSKEALELLSRAGVVRLRSTGIGLRVSIEPKMVPAAEKFLEGGQFGVEAVDAWVQN